MKYRKALFITLIMFIVLCDFIIITFPKTEKKIIKNELYYDLEINHPVTRYKEIDDKINDYINSEITKIKEKASKGKVKYKLNIDYKQYIFNNINTIVLNKSIVSKDKELEEDKVLFRYNSKDMKMVTYKDLFKENNDYYNKLKSIVYYNHNNYDIGSNFDKYYFDKDGLHMMLDTDYVIELNKIKNMINFDYIYNGFINYNDIKEERDINYYKDKKIVCLTVDDGPAGNNTSRLLDELNKRDAKATFFVLGNRVGAQKDLIKRMYMEGHSIGNHSYDHARLTNLGEASLENNLNKTRENIKKIIGSYPVVTRPPYGTHNSFVDSIITTPIILWNVDPQDWKYRDASIVRDNIVNHTVNGSIILIHDLYPTSIDGALQALDILKEQGYNFVSIEEMFKIKGIDINNKGTYGYFH